MRRDAIVLGAGIVGLSAALQLQARGRDVALVDRGGAGEGTSHGNAGLIERASIYPYAFPRRLADLARIARGMAPEVHVHLGALPGLIPWLARYWWHSAPRRHETAMHGARPLIERSLDEHEGLIAEAGAGHLLRRTGWTRLFRTEARLEAALDEARRLARFGLAYDALDARALREREPHLSDAAVGAIHLRDTAAIVDPGALSKALLALFERRGGLFVQGDARTLARDGAGWTVTTAAGPLAGRDAVVALGAWSDRVTRPLGLRIPLAVKRGYHMHYRPAGNAVLHAPVLDAERGYVLAPMARGLRLTTGAEFARADAPPTPVQVTRAEAAARELLPLAERLDPAPWMGARPCLPDMLPVIGPAPGHPGLWLLFGHAHHGLTLGPVTGRLLAEMIVGEAPFTDPAPYRADRF